MPTSINDRDASVCNIDIEAWIENKSKWNWSKAEVLKLPDDLAKVQVPVDRYDAAALDSIMPAAVLDLLNIEDDTLFVDTSMDILPGVVEEDPSPAAIAPVNPSTTSKTPLQKQLQTPALPSTTTTLFAPPASDEIIDTARIQGQYPWEAFYKELTPLWSEWLGEPAAASQTAAGKRPYKHNDNRNIQLLSMIELWTMSGRQIGRTQNFGADATDADDDWASGDLIDCVTVLYGNETILPNTYIPSTNAESQFMGGDGGASRISELRRETKAMEDLATEREEALRAQEEATSTHRGAPEDDQTAIPPPVPLREYPLRYMPDGTIDVLLSWNVRGNHWITIKATIKILERMIFLEIRDSFDLTDASENYKEKYNERMKAVAFAVHTYFSFATDRPDSHIFGFQVKNPRTVPSAKQTGGHCGYHVLHNIRCLSTGREPVAELSTKLEREHFGQKERWLAAKVVYRHCTGKDADLLPGRRLLAGPTPLFETPQQPTPLLEHEEDDTPMGGIDQDIVDEPVDDGAMQVDPPSDDVNNDDGPTVSSSPPPVAPSPDQSDRQDFLKATRAMALALARTMIRVDMQRPDNADDLIDAMRGRLVELEKIQLMFESHEIEKVDERRYKAIAAHVDLGQFQDSIDIVEQDLQD